MASATFQALRILAIIERLFALGTNENFEKVFSEHVGILRQTSTAS